MGVTRSTFYTAATLGSLAMVVALASPVSAQPRRALLVARGLDDGATRALAEAVATSTEMEVITPDGVTERLRAAAGELGDDGSTRRRDRALERARTAYVQLQLGDARQAYDEALAATLAGRHAAAEPEAVARIFFERALVALAAQQQSQATEDFLVAATIDPSLAPDAEVYGAPVIRAYGRARSRARRGRARRIRVERAPEDAEVRVNGALVGQDGRVRVRGEGPHLVTASRPGFVPRSQLVRAASSETEVAVVLPEAEGALLARDALAIWTASDASLPPRGADVVARAAGVTRIVEARGGEQDGVVELVLHAPGSAEPLRSARGARRSWEPQPFFVLAEALVGRVVTAPPAEPDRAPVSLAVSAPSRVPPGEPLVLGLRVGDPDARLRSIRGECGDRSAERQLEAAEGSRSLRLEMVAPEEATELLCLVVGRDVMGETLVRFPAPDESLLVEVRPDGGDDGVVIGLTVTAIAVAVAAAVVTAVVLTQDREQIGVIVGLD